MSATAPRRVRIHLPAHDGMPETVRGVASKIGCDRCDWKYYGASHAEARKALRLHRLEAHTPGRTG